MEVLAAPAQAKAAALRQPSPLDPWLHKPPPCLALATLPTAVQRAAWLDVAGAEVWIKRDDLSSPVYGGGKVRKLEWILANPPFNGDAPVVSVGGIGSHHLLALALMLQPQGRIVHCLTFEQVLTPHVHTNLAVLLSTGARLWHTKTRARLPWVWLAYHLWRRPEVKGVYMPAGASSDLGCFGFVVAGLELARQVEAGELPAPKTIFITAGSAGTSAGLALGLAIAGLSTHLHLVSSVEPWAFNALMYRRKMGQALSRLKRHGLRPELAQGGVKALLGRAGVTWSIDHSQVGGGYGVPTEFALHAQQAAAEHGVELEPTYTAKCVAGLRAAQQRGVVQGPVLFWNTHASNTLNDAIRPGWEEHCPASLLAVLSASSQAGRPSSA